MAHVNHQYCKDCCQDTLFVNRKCVDCKHRKYKTDMAAWKSLSIEEKLFDIHKRLQKLEAGPIQY